MPSGAPLVSRRRVLVGAAALTAVAATSACGTDSRTPPEADRLIEQLDLARRDATMARTAAAAASPFYTPLLNIVADDRAQHAEALSTEISRLAGGTSSVPSAPAASSPSTPAPTQPDVIAALRQSSDSAAKLAADVDGYRAGLLGSIAASCTASATVALTLKENAP